MDRLTEMEAFATVVDQGGFTDAAKKMGISKSAVSKHVSSLEARLGARLLNRTTRRVSPTEIEEVVYASGLVSEVAALGIAHPELGQAIVLVAVVSPT